MMTGNEFKKIVERLRFYLAEYFTPLGFTSTSEEYIVFKRELPSYSDFFSIYTSYNKTDNLFSATFECTRRIELIESFWEEYKDLLGLSGGIPFTFSGNIYENRNGYMNIATTQQTPDDELVEKIGKQLIAYWETDISPRLVQYSDIKVLDQKVNARLEGSELALSNGGLWFYKLIIAKLAGNSNYDQIYEYILTSHQRWMEQEPSEYKYYQDHLWAFQQLYQKLKDKDVNPLDNPVLI